DVASSGEWTLQEVVELVRWCEEMHRMVESHYPNAGLAFAECEELVERIFRAARGIRCAIQDRVGVHVSEGEEVSKRSWIYGVDPEHIGRNRFRRKRHDVREMHVKPRHLSDFLCRPSGPVLSHSGQ